MKVILYGAVTVDGFIANTNDDASWISVDEWNTYSAAAQKAGAIIVGRRTYHIFTKQPEFVELKDVTVVVVSHDEVETLAPNHQVAHSPKEALELLKDFDEVIITGGGIVNASFMAENLVDELFLDVEPTTLGHGLPLFNGKSLHTKLQLLGHKKITENEIQLHYVVLR